MCIDSDGDVELVIEGQENTIIFNPAVLVQVTSEKSLSIEDSSKRKYHEEQKEHMQSPQQRKEGKN